METIKYLGYDCVSLANKTIRLLVTQSTGPRIISLRFNEGENLFAELPEEVTVRSDGKNFHFIGGHRLWVAPEMMPRTYELDDNPVQVVELEHGLSVVQPIEELSGIQKSLKITLSGDKSQIVVEHRLTNFSPALVDCAPWAITQLKPGGVAILPRSQEQTGYQANRTLTLWPYTDITDPNVQWGNRYIFVAAAMKAPFKVGFQNPRGWLAYWQGGILFVKRVVFNPQAVYCDYGSSSECFCKDRFIELETLAPITALSPGESALHIETWDLYANVAFPRNETEMDGIVKDLGLE
jgi:hypothetical protein